MSEPAGWLMKLGDIVVAFTDDATEAGWYRSRGLPPYTVTPLVAAPPEDGRPTYAELADWIQRQGVCSEACLDEGHCVCGLDDLLARIPKEEP